MKQGAALKEKASLCINSSAPLVPRSPQGTIAESQEADKERGGHECGRRRVTERTELLFVQKKKPPDSSPPEGEKMDSVVVGGARREFVDADEECLCL